MWTRQHKKSKLRFAIFPIIALSLLGYFGFHTVNGSLGMNSSDRYDLRIDELRIELAALEKTSANYAKRTTLLRDGNLERDLIDEQARVSLGLTRANEVVLFNTK